DRDAGGGQGPPGRVDRKPGPRRGDCHHSPGTTRSPTGEQPAASSAARAGQLQGHADHSQRRRRTPGGLQGVHALRLLLDTHAFLWFVLNDAQLSTAARTAISDPANDVLVSPATYWE